MIAVRRLDVDEPAWQAWRAKAQRAMDELITTYHPLSDIKLQEEIYKQAMPYLIEMFHGKCAYCETMMAANQPGDVEHYRPKGRIRDKEGKFLKIKYQDAEVNHPGYWWLAYEWRNLLPACTDCNRRRYHGDGDPAGKAEFFEVRGERAVRPGDDLEKEQALLLDPTTPGFDPKKHFEINADGTIRPLTDEARYSCELLGLNLRETLVAQREGAYLEASQAFSYLLANAAGPPSELRRTRRQINDMWEGRTAYGAFARQALEVTRERIWQNTRVRFELPLP